MVVAGDGKGDSWTTAAAAAAAFEDGYCGAKQHDER